MYNFDKVRSVMGKIFYLMGKSGSGKDTIYNHVKGKMPRTLYFD